MLVRRTRRQHFEVDATLELLIFSTNQKNFGDRCTSDTLCDDLTQMG